MNGIKNGIKDLHATHYLCPKTQEGIMVLFLETESYYISQAGLKPRDQATSASQVLGAKVCATIPGFTKCF